MALWQSQMEDHTSDWLRVVPIFGLGHTMNAKTYRWISTRKKVDIGLGGGRDKPLHPADMLLYSWDEGLDVKYEAKCANIGYGFLPFSFFSLGKLEKDAITLLKQVRKFSMTQGIRARFVVHIFNRINFAITKGEGLS
nr:hypothetical protein [Tanacetum cinerariifolium]